MRPLSYRSDDLRSLLMRTKIATLDELKQALGTSVDVTVFRKMGLRGIVWVKTPDFEPPNMPPDGPWQGS
jgi:hypothetical protein